MRYLRTELHRQDYEVRRKSTITTKLDAPYSLLVVRGQASKVPVGHEIKGEELEAVNVQLQDLMPPESLTAIGVTESANTIQQRILKVKNEKQEAERPIGLGYTQAGRVLADLQTRIEEKGQLTRTEKKFKRLEAQIVQSETVKERNKRLAEEVKAITGRRPEISRKVAKKIAKAEMKKSKRAANEEKRKYKLRGFANGTAKEANLENSLDQEVSMIHPKHPNRGTTDKSSTFAVRFTSQEEESRSKVVLQSGAQDAPPVTVRRHLSVSPTNPSKKHGAILQESLVVKAEPISEHNDSVPIIREESEGISPGTPHRGRDGNVFMVRRHATMNPFERLEAIRKVGEITSRDQAMGLHSQYHLPLFDKQPEEGPKS